MIKRLLLIAIILGLGQIFIIVSLKFISHALPVKSFSLFGQIESNFQFLIILIAAGILSDAIRKITVSEEWKKEYLKYQSARFYFCLLLLPLLLLFFINKSFLIFLIAPIIGLSGEYAFYGLGKPVTAALVALVRIFIPYGMTAIIAAMFPDYYLESFIISLCITYFLTGLFVSKLLKTPYWVTPSLKAVRLYFTSLNLGLINISLYVQGLGMMILIPLLFPGNFEVISIAFIGLKLYTIIKSVIRIIHQALVREMIKLEECLTVDKLSMILAFAFMAALLIFPNSTITLVFGQKFLYAVSFFQLLAFASIIYSFCFSLATNAILRNFDNKLLLVCVISAASGISSLLIFSIFFEELYAIGAALVLAEALLSVGLLIIYSGENVIKQRLVFMLQNVAILAIPLLMKFFILEDSLPGLITGVACYSLVLLFLNLRKFNSVKLTKIDY